MVLLSKELKSLLTTPVGIFFLLIFLLSAGVLLWLVPGNYNIPDAGYASLDAFFALAPVLLIVLIPGLSGRIFSEEKNRKTFDLLLTRPLSLWKIIGVKSFALFLVVFLAFLFTSVYVVSIYVFAMPAGNMDWGAILCSYLGLLVLSVALIGITVFASSLTSSQVMAFIFSLVGCVGFYYGFDLLSGLCNSGNMQLIISQLGLSSHVVSLQKGVLDSRDLLALLSVGILFYLLTFAVLSFRKQNKVLLLSFFLLLLLCVFNAFWHFRWDLTNEKRYTIGAQTREILQSLDRPLDVEIYLSGDLNAGFTRLQRSVTDMLSEFQQIAPGKLRVRVTDPYGSEDQTLLTRLKEKGMPGIAVNERNKDGKVIQKIVYPWLVISNDQTEIPVSLLVHLKDKSGEENLNASIEDLEYQLIRGIYRLAQPAGRKIVFIEGHGELTEEMTGDITDALSLYYQVDRGALTKDAGQLDGYEAVIIAGPQLPFEEWEKFVLDQYIMKGGKVMFLVNGVKLSPEQLAAQGESPSMANDVRLDDQLFTYGIRINPVLMQDARCLTIPVQTEPEGAEGAVKPLPWFFAPILTPDPEHPVTKDVMYVKSEFVSSLSFTGNNPGIKKTPLLLTSGYAHGVHVPEMISLQSAENIPDTKYFNEKDVPVGALLEGVFPSVFDHRPIPEGMNAKEIIPRSKPARIIVIGSEEIIRNENVDGRPVPLGYDRYSGVQFGNKDFLVNAITYLTDDPGLMNLRSKHLKIRMLDRQKMESSGGYLPWVNLFLPLLFPLILYLILNLQRKRKYFG